MKTQEFLFGHSGGVFNVREFIGSVRVVDEWSRDKIRPPF